MLCIAEAANDIATVSDIPYVFASVSAMDTQPRVVPAPRDAHPSYTSCVGKCIRCQVHGRVQGVWFRASTREQAMSFGLTGWVRNRADGRVEILACGGDSALAQFRSWLAQGPPLARVDALEVSEGEWQSVDGFEIR